MANQIQTIDSRIEAVFNSMGTIDKGIVIRMEEDDYITQSGIVNDFYLMMAAGLIAQKKTETVKIWDGVSLKTVRKHIEQPQKKQKSNQLPPIVGKVAELDNLFEDAPDVAAPIKGNIFEINGVNYILSEYGKEQPANSLAELNGSDSLGGFTILKNIANIMSNFPGNSMGHLDRFLSTGKRILFVEEGTPDHQNPLYPNFMKDAFTGKNRMPVVSIGAPNREDYVLLVEKLMSDGYKFETQNLALIAQLMAKDNQTSIRKWNALVRKHNNATSFGIEQIAKNTGDEIQFPYKTANEKLAEFVDIDHVYDYLKKMSSLMGQIKKQGRKDTFFHTMLVGNPGTGKTTVVNAIAETFVESGFLKRGNVEYLSGSSIVAGQDHVGGPVTKITEMFEKARGGILILDEIYALSKGTFYDTHGEDVVNALMSLLDKYKHEMTVFFIGYNEHIDQLMSMNPGFRSRVPWTLEMKDYSPKTLEKIFYHAVSERNLKIASDAKEIISAIFEKMYHSRNPKEFGNAREVINLVSEIVMNLGQKDLIQKADIPEKYLPKELPTIDGLLSEIRENICGSESLQKYVIGLRDQVELRLRQGKPLKDINFKKGLHLTITGETGTGKTEAAYYIAKALHAMGLLESDEVVTAKSMLAGYEGQTPIKIERMLNLAQGKLFLLDDIEDMLSGGSFSSQAATVLVRELGEKGSFTGIACVAGYSQTLKRFYNLNEGMAGRFTTNIHMKNPDAEAYMQILKIHLEKENYTVQEGFYDTAKSFFMQATTKYKDVFQPLIDTNARFVTKNMIPALQATLSKRLKLDEKADPFYINIDDLNGACSSLYHSLKK